MNEVEGAIVNHMMIHGWLTLDQMVEVAKPFLPESDDRVVRAEIRKLMQRKSEDGWPEFPCIVRRNEDTGKEEHIYKQETLFSIDDYQRVINYHVWQSEYYRDLRAN